MDTIVYTVEGKEKGRYELPEYFNTEVKTALLHEITTGYLANLRSGTHATKTRGEVSFSGAKPWKQKGTGNARAGQRNSPLWRKGGIVFGPFGEKVVSYLVLNREIIIRRCLNKKENLH